MTNPTQLPDGLPVPADDGACDHLPGAALPPIALPSTAGKAVDLSALDGPVVVYCYPMTGRPDTPLPDGWDALPGARGCTPQACAYRDHHDELTALGAEVFGLSTQGQRLPARGRRAPAAAVPAARRRGPGVRAGARPARCSRSRA